MTLEIIKKQIILSLGLMIFENQSDYVIESQAKIGI